MPMSAAKAAGGGKPSNGDKASEAGVSETAIPKLKEEIQKLQATKKHLEEMGCEAAVEEVVEKLAALQQHLQSQKPLSQQLERALAMQRKAAAGKDKAEQVLQQTEQSLLEAKSRVQDAQNALEEANYAVAQLRKEISL